jgi:flagellar hook protein FlgE
VGIGTTVAAVSQEFAQGNITTTSNPLDVAINGDGFFRLSTNGAISFSRNGQFNIDPDGYLVNAEKQRVTGYGTGPDSSIVATDPIEIRLETTDIAPRPTSTFRLGANLDAGESQPTTTVFSLTDPNSYNKTTSGSVYDTLGNAHVLGFYFVKTPSVGQWNVYGSVNGTGIGDVDLGAGPGSPLVLNFDSTGSLVTPMPTTASLTIASGATSPINLSLDMSAMTQFGSAFGVNTLSQNGYSAGRLAGINIGTDGIIRGRYTNGQQQDLAQIALAQFANPSGLRSLGENQWVDSADSGLPLIGTPDAGSLGSLQASAVENSNVDLTAQLVAMITAQRYYQANAQSIKTQDEVMQTLVNLR